MPHQSKSKQPGTTGGSTKGKCTILSSNDLPKNDFLASSQAIAIAGMSISATQNSATFKDSPSMAISAGVSMNISSIEYSRA